MKEVIQKIRLLALDVDGVLTDGKIIWTGNGEEIRHFHVHDGTGLYMLKRLGYERALISGKKSKAVEKRAKELGFDHIYLGISNKVEILDLLVQATGLSYEQVCYMGDDLMDLGVMNLVGFPVSVANGVPEVKKAAKYITQNTGGHGAVREVVELILKTQGRWQEILDLILAASKKD